MAPTQRCVTSHTVALMAALLVTVIIASPTAAQTDEWTIVPQLGISVRSSPSDEVDGLIVCLGWTGSDGLPDTRTGLSVGDIIVKANDQIMHSSSAQELFSQAEESARAGQPLKVAFKKRIGPPVKPSTFRTPDSRAEAKQYVYESELSTSVSDIDLIRELSEKTLAAKKAVAEHTAKKKATEESAKKAVAKEASKKMAAEEAAKKKAEQAAIDSKKWTSKDGRALSASDIISHNKRVDAAMRTATKGAEGLEAQRIAAAQSNVSWVVKHVQSGDREKLRKFMVKLSELSAPARRDIDFYLQQTPAGTYIVACDNGEAVTWIDAYGQGLGALIEAELGLPAR